MSKKKRRTKPRVLPPPVTHRVEADRFQKLLEDAKAFDSPHVDLAPLLGLSSPLLLGVNDLHEAVAHFALNTPTLPALSVRWDQKEVTLEHIEGGAMAKFTMKF